MIQHHYEFLCGSKTAKHRNTLCISECVEKPQEGLHVIDHPKSGFGKRLNLFLYRNTPLSMADFKSLVVTEVAKVGFEEVDAALLDAAIEKEVVK